MADITASDFRNPVARRKFLLEAIKSARSRAAKAGLQFVLPPDHAETMYQRQDGRCAVSGIRFNMQRYEAAFVKHPFAPSIDRRLSSGGYTVDNVRLVCVAVNFGMGQWGEEVFLALARSAVALEKQRKKVAGDTPPDEWEETYRERIAAAEKALLMLPEHRRLRQKKVIAGLKSALKKGLKKLKEAGRKAANKRRRVQTSPEYAGDHQ